VYTHQLEGYLFRENHLERITLSGSVDLLDSKYSQLWSRLDELVSSLAARPGAMFTLDIATLETEINVEAEIEAMLRHSLPLCSAQGILHYVNGTRRHDRIIKTQTGPVFSFPIESRYNS
jgi:hypothetical protein